MKLGDKESIRKFAAKVYELNDGKFVDGKQFVSEVRDHFGHWFRRTLKEIDIIRAVSEDYEHLFPPDKKTMEEIARAWINKAGKFKPYHDEKPDKEGYYWRTVMNRKIKFRAGDDVNEKIDHTTWQEEDHSDEEKHKEAVTRYRRRVAPVDLNHINSQRNYCKKMDKWITKYKDNIVSMSETDITLHQYEQVYKILTEDGQIPHEDDYDPPYDGTIPDELNVEYDEDDVDVLLKNILGFGDTYRRMFQGKEITYDQVQKIIDYLHEHNEEFRDNYDENIKYTEKINDLQAKGFAKAKYLFRGTDSYELDSYLEYTPDMQGEDSNYPHMSTTIDPGVANGYFGEEVVLIFDKSKHKSGMLKYGFTGVTEGEAGGNAFNSAAPYPLQYADEKEYRMEWGAGYRDNGLVAIHFKGELSEKDKKDYKDKYEKIAPVYFKGEILA